MFTAQGPLFLHLLDESSDGFTDADAEKELRREVPTSSWDPETLSLTVLWAPLSSPQTRRPGSHSRKVLWLPDQAPKVKANPTRTAFPGLDSSPKIIHPGDRTQRCGSSQWEPWDGGQKGPPHRRTGLISLIRILKL